MARRLVRWYGLRWGIECWHQVLKDVCRVESRQMESAQALSRALVLDMIVAWRVLLLCRLGKAHPNLPAAVLYRPEELAILETFQKKALAGTRPLRRGGRCSRRANPAQRNPCPADALSSQFAGGDAGRVLGSQSRRPSRS